MHNGQWAQRLGPDTLLDLDIFRQLADTALTSDAPIEEHGTNGLPKYVALKNVAVKKKLPAWEG